MKSLIMLVFLLGSISLLAGYLRFIVDNQGNIPLNHYRCTGCLGAVLTGMFLGTGDLFSRRISGDAKSALMIYIGVALFWIGFRVGN